MFKKVLALFGALFVLAAPAAALAQTATYNISGTFTAPATGSFSGSYVVNTGSNTMVSANIQVTAGKANDGVTDLPANTYIYANGESANAFSYAAAVPATANVTRGGFLIVSGTKASPTAVTTFGDGVCLNTNCVSLAPGTTTTRGGSGTVVLAPAPVPTLSEWAMILFGLLLAGGAALYIQRRQLTA
ncbi:IPTL-CTERM sorting domain-containing protein [Brevundimonas sp.]|uniref:IPTL-CTERM sorting domain-containing protein n=1 Tax=Brevundimonas sp. TaxID=1871086 RepID=UPI0026246706|nr:IPTL-CTERM sorting domain-containing protein [Brevundimonas sp.]